MMPAIARAMSITRIETTIIPKDNFDEVSGGEDPDALGNDTQLTRLVLKYCCGGKFPLQMEVSRRTCRLFIYKVTRVKSI
jgi:hypothetical protein